MANQAKFDRSTVRFTLKETNKGYFQFVLAENGKYGLDDIDSVLAVLAKYPDDTLNQYQIWLDWEGAPVQKTPVRFDAIVKFAKAKGTTAELVKTRRPFPQVKIKLSRDGGVSTGHKASKLREL
jgi:ABC-type transport system substrate-binding protein